MYRIYTFLFSSLILIVCSATAAQPNPVRNDVPRLGQQEIVMMRHAYLEAGSYEYWYEQSSEKVWPYVEKIGVRPVGQWRVLYLPNSAAQESEDYDEVFILVRYASYAHYVAVRDNAVLMGGNGPDYQALRSALGQLDDMTLASSIEFLRGEPFASPPQYTPGSGENFRLVD